MFFLLLLSFAFFGFLDAVDITAVGFQSYYPFIKAWADAYTLIDPTFNLSFTPLTDPYATTNQMLWPNQSIDFSISETEPTLAQYQTLQGFPFLISTVVAQVNFNFQQDIVLNTTILADIYLGKITNWADPIITALNPNLPMPNTTIKVFYRSDPTAITAVWTFSLGATSPEFAAISPPNLILSPNITSLPNFYGYPSLLAINGAVASTPNSIGYVQYYSVARDTGLYYARLINPVSGEPVDAGGQQAASDFLVLNPLLEPDLVLNAPVPNAWPVVATKNLLIHKNPKDCEKARALYKFFRWSLTAPNPRASTLQLGCIPLGQNITNTVINALSQIQCDGETVSAYDVSYQRTPVENALFVIANLVLFLALFLSVLHIYNFRHSLINLIYTVIFVVGTILTLLSPIFWWLDASERGICQARLWTMSLGFSIILGTMFSRTWQLQEIYTLQKHGMDALRAKVSTNKTYVQLAMTLSGVVFINILILAIWGGVDPLSPILIVEDDIALTGYWTCRSHNMAAWLIVELLFFLFLLCFGVYVIYNTWAFQRAVVLQETRWVLFALYNVILTIFAIVPFLSIINLSDRVLALLVTAAIDVSAGSIACAVLLPRVLAKFKESWKGTKPSGMSKEPATKGSVHNVNKSKTRRPSRTPEDELVNKLTDPHPRSGPSIELQPTRAESPSTVTIPDVEAQIPGARGTIHEPNDLDSPSQHPLTSEFLHWSENPIKEQIKEEREGEGNETDDLVVK